MCRVIYTKFSNERDDRYSVRTDICQDENHVRVVCKKPYDSAGQEHVRAMYANYLHLREQYAGSRLQINQCELKEDCVEFEYIAGDTLEQQLDNLLFSKKYDEFSALAEEYLSLIRKNGKLSRFEMTPQFEEIFGNVPLKEEESLPFSDIDMIFSNIMVQNDKWVLIDYEWTYDFPIPLNYIIYRIMSCYYNLNPIRKEICEKHCNIDFGIPEEKMALYRQMENHFIQYISGGKKTIAQTYQDTKEHALTRESILRMGTINPQIRYQVYYDFGTGLSEENSSIGYEISSNELKRRSVKLPKGCIRVRFDPGDRKGMLYIELIRTDKEIHHFDTNGIQLGENIVLFTEDDPWVMFSIEGTNEKLEILYLYTELEQEYLESVNKLYSESKHQREDLENRRQAAEDMNVALEGKKIKLEEKILVLQEQLEQKRKETEQLQLEKAQKEKFLQQKEESLQQKEAEIQEICRREEQYKKRVDEMTNSTSWKVTAPLRKIGAKMKER